jgi:hypothetical protein
MNMSRLSAAVSPAAGHLMPQPKKIFRAWIFILLLCALGTLRGAAQDEDYIAIIGITDQADALNASGKTAQAREKYLEAQRALTVFQRANPGWNTPTVSFRIKYLRDKIADSAGPGTAAKPGELNEGTKAAVAAKSPVTLLAAGSEPRTVLRLRPAVGDKLTLVMTQKTSMEMGMAGNQLPAMDLPPIQLTMDLEVKKISDDGEIDYQLNFTDATVEADKNGIAVQAEMMKTALDGIRGLTGAGKVTAQGIVKSVTMQLPARPAPQLAQTVGQMTEVFSSVIPALPEEAVGVGAKWAYQTKSKTQGLTTDQTTTYELVAREGDQFTLRTTIAQSAANQKMDSPVMPGMKVDLVKLTGTGTGTSTQELGRITPQTASVDEETRMSLGMNLGQQKQSMDMKITVKVTIESK